MTSTLSRREPKITKGRTRKKNRDNLEQLNPSELYMFVLEWPAFRTIVDSFPIQEPGKSGPQWKYPPLIHALFLLIASTEGSLHKAERALDEIWPRIQKRIGSEFPEYPNLQRPPKPERKALKQQRRRNPNVKNRQALTRKHFEYYRDSYMVPASAEIQSAVRVHAQTVAYHMGLMQGQGSLNRPSLWDTVYGDGVVFAARSRAREGDLNQMSNGELRPRRFDADSLLHHQGDDTVAIGLKVVAYGATTGHPNERLLLDIAPCRSNEAEVALELLWRLQSELPGLRSITYDKAIVGVHVNQILKRGLTPFVRVVDGAKKSQQRKPIGLSTFSLTDGSKQDHEVIAIEGWPHIQVIANASKQEVPLVRRELKRRQLASGDFTWTGVYELPDEGPTPPALRRASTLIRLDNSTDDALRQLNRTHYLRAFTPGDPVFDRHHALRSSAESHNAWFKDHHLPHRKAPVYGHDKLQLHLAFSAVLCNTRAAVAFAQRTDTPVVGVSLEELNQ